MDRSKSKFSARKETRRILEEFYPEYRDVPKGFWKTHLTHHLDGDPWNNAPENLMVISHKKHREYHNNPSPIRDSTAEERWNKIRLKVPLSGSLLTPGERKVLVTFLYNKGLTKEIPV